MGSFDMAQLSTDYLVVGTGASAMAFVDTLVAHTDAEVVLVDRRHAPGGHWVDAYPFVRLHQPSAYYGVPSLPLGEDRIDTEGVNAGFYERATAAELQHYYEQALGQLVATGRVRFLGSTKYLGTEAGAHVVESRLTGGRQEIAVRRRLVDATYIQSDIPATHVPPFAVADDATLVTPNALVDLGGTPAGFTLVGGGKTAMDVAFWLLEQGVDPDRIRWIRPRDSWYLDRTFTQPLEQAGNLIEYQSRFVEACAHAPSGPDFARRLEEHGMMCRIDDTIDPEINRGATVARVELEAVRDIERVVRLGWVDAIGETAIELAGGSVPTTPDEVHVDCTAQGLATAPMIPIYDGDRVTVQFTTLGVAPWSAAILGFVEALDIDDDERNRLCRPVPRTGLIIDQLWVNALGFQAEAPRREHPEVSAWGQTCRLNPGRSMAEQFGNPDLQPAFERLMVNLEPAMSNLADHSSRVSSPPPTSTTTGGRH
ncbi:MAG: hypothetical protein AAGA99_10175 [Actinomycetota bacterium]